MKFVLLVEGDTEEEALPDFFKRWLDPRLNQRVGIHIENSKSWSTLLRAAPQKAKDFLNDPKYKSDVVAVIGLMDLYGPDFYPVGVKTVADRYAWGKQYIEKQVNQEKFRQHFAVHETEAWLLSDPSIFPAEIRKEFAAKIAQPETINFNEPPAKLLDRLHENKFKRGYKKVAQGKELFGKLDPKIAYEKCPYLKILLDDMLKLAQDAEL